MKRNKKPEPTILARNKKALHDYMIEEKMEAGIQLQGSEVKSVRAGRVNLRDSFARVKDEEVFLHNCHISHYPAANQLNHEPTRTRKLLLRKDEIRRLVGKIKRKGYTLVPLSLYLSGNIIKVELAMARGKTLFDKRRDLADKEAKRDMERAFREGQKDR